MLRTNLWKATRGMVLVFVGRVCRSGLLDEISRLARLILEEAGVPCRCAGGMVIIVRSYSGPEPFHNREVEGPLEGSFFLRGKKNIFTTPCLARGKGKGWGETKVSENRVEKMATTFIIVLLTSSHSLTTHFLDRRRHFFFYAGTIEANEISPSREFEESFISTTLYCTRWIMRYRFAIETNFYTCSDSLLIS